MIAPNALFKVGIVGCGKVGMSAAYALFLQGGATEIVLHGRDKQKVLGEKYDLEHALPFVEEVDITATDSYEDLAGCHVIVYTAGAPQKEGETRLDLCVNNRAILEEALPQIHQHAPDAVILMVANPVDILTHIANEIIPDAKGRIFGSGTTLDTARFRYHLSKHIQVNARSIHAYVLGEHGDSSFPVFEHATIGGKRLLDFTEFTPEVIQDAYIQARDAAYNIIATKGASYYAIGVVISRIVKTILSDARTVLPVSVPLHNYYGHSDVSLSVPCIVGSSGIVQVLETDLSEQEQEGLARSVEALKKFC